MSNMIPSCKQRFLFMDLARGLAIFFMVMIHVLGEMSSTEVNGSIFGSVLTFLGGPPAAPVFVFLMGSSLMLSRHNSARKTALRGVKLLFLAYLLNFFREYVPASVALYFEIISKNDLALGGLSSTLVVIDILHFAGLALIILSLLRKIFHKPMHYLLAAMAVALTSPFLWGKVSGHLIFDWLLTLLWGTGGEMVAFPIFPWLSYALLGMAFAQCLLQSTDQINYLKRTAIVGLYCLIFGTILISTNYSYHVGDYWRSGPGSLLWISGFIVIFLYFCQKITTKITDNYLSNTLYFWSSNVTVFYVIHWIFIGWMSFFICVNSIPMTIFLIATTLTLTHICTKKYVAWKNS